MREADKAAVTAGRLFVSQGRHGRRAAARSSTPAKAAIEGDLYDICQGKRRRRADEITVYKNAGGGHLDLMTAEFIAQKIGLARLDRRGVMQFVERDAAEQAIDPRALVDHFEACHRQMRAASDVVLLSDPRPGSGECFLAVAGWQHGQAMASEVRLGHARRRGPGAADR